MTTVPRPKPPEVQKQVSVQVPETWTARIDRARARMSAAAGGITVTQSDVLRVVIDKGLAALEAELPPEGKGKRRRGG
jgi:hypothetical protein